MSIGKEQFVEALAQIRKLLDETDKLQVGLWELEVELQRVRDQRDEARETVIALGQIMSGDKVALASWCAEWCGDDADRGSCGGKLEMDGVTAACPVHRFLLLVGLAELSDFMEAKR